MKHARRALRTVSLLLCGLVICSCGSGSDQLTTPASQQPKRPTVGRPGRSLIKRRPAHKLSPVTNQPAVAPECLGPDDTLSQLATETRVGRVAIPSHRFVSPPSSRTSDVALGVQAELRSRSGPDMYNVLTRMTQAHLDFTREDFSWASIEPQPGLFCWGRTDFWMYGAARAGVQVIAVPDASPSWAESTISTAPTDGPGLRRYATFVRELMGRYGAYGSFWSQHPTLRPDPITYVDVWNEPYINYFWHRDYPDPAGYASMFEAVVHATRPVDPHARFLLEADVTAQDGSPFLSRVLSAQPAIVHDAYAVSTHPYASDGWGPDVCSRAGTDASRRYQTCRILDLRKILNNYGASKVGLFITELGWGVNGRTRPSTSPSTVARYVRQTFSLLRTQWRGIVTGLIWYRYQSPPSGPGWRGDFGLIQPNGVPYPAWRALADEARRGIPLTPGGPG